MELYEKVGFLIELRETVGKQLVVYLSIPQHSCELVLKGKELISLFS